MPKRQFKIEVWDYDGDGPAYIISKDECTRAEVPSYICEYDDLDSKCKEEMYIEEGWCTFQVRSDWFNLDGPHGWYVVERCKDCPKDHSGKKKNYFPVWIVRREEWY